MNNIQVLDQLTIDQIAAGEVIERPASIVKELTENSIDAKASSITAEIKEGGISFIRISDNGCGIEPKDVRPAFLRHSTSKIRKVDDLMHITSLGFRGEALSSIAAVSQVEVITKASGQALGSTYRIEGGKEISLDETGAPQGTTFLIRQLFYNTPVRRNFLKTAVTEASHVGELMTRLSLSHPEISFQFINNGQSKLHTSGNGSLKDVIYHVYGREVAAHLMEVSYEKEGFRMSGYIGEPAISRGNRNFEHYFINGRYVKSSLISKAIEDAYKDVSMQHKYPFTVLHMTIDTQTIDINVHPTKMEVRFREQQQVYQTVFDALHETIHHKELIPHMELPEEPVLQAKEAAAPQKASYIAKKPSALCEKQEEKQSAVGFKQSAVGFSELPKEDKNLDYYMKKMKERVLAYHNRDSCAEVADQTGVYKPAVQERRIRETVTGQMNFFEEKLLSGPALADYHWIGQLFDTYWLVEFSGQLYIIDQHAAHERILYEQLLANMKTRETTSQNISPPIILELSMKEAGILTVYHQIFSDMGFEIEEFGQESYAVRAVPDHLSGIAKKDLLLEMIDSLSDEIYTGLAPHMIEEKIASMSCKAAVKGNHKLSQREAEALIGELLKLDNPYHCPHGRPTIITMSKRELEKKFKRIV